MLVTGGSGFLGGYVLAELIRLGHEPVALARGDLAERTVRSRGAEPVRGDLDDAVGLTEAFAAARCDVLVNLASLGFGHAGSIVTAARRAGLERAVFVSTTAVTTRLPTASKHVRLEAERRIEGSGLAWTILRPTMIYGAPGDRNLERLLGVLARVPVLPVPGRDHLQQPVHVADVAQAVVSATEREDAVGRRYDIAGPEPITFAGLLAASARATGSQTRFVPVPLWPALMLARGYERCSRNPRIRAEQVLRLAEDKAFAIDDAARDLGFAPRPFPDGIAAEARALGLAPALVSAAAGLGTAGQATAGPAVGVPGTGTPA